MAESPERREELGRILMEYRLRAENAPSHAYGWALNEIKALYRPAPDAAMVERLNRIREHLKDIACTECRSNQRWLLKLMGIGEEEK